MHYYSEAVTDPSHRGRRADSPTHLDVGSLVLRARTGDPAALVALMEQSYPALTRFCAQLVGPNTAEDLAQETVLRTAAALEGLRDPTRFSAWLFGIAANLARRWWERRNRWPLSLERLALTYPDVDWASAYPHGTPDLVVEEADCPGPPAPGRPPEHRRRPAHLRRSPRRCRHPHPLWWSEMMKRPWPAGRPLAERAMIVFVNGPFGIGKSSVAARLVELLRGSLLFDPEEVGYFLRKILRPIDDPPDFQHLALWRRLTVIVAEQVLATYGRPLVMPMTIWRRAYFDEVVGGLRAAGIDVRHFCLVATPGTVYARLRDRGDAPVDGFAWSQVEPSLAAFASPAFERHIDTGAKTVDAIAAEIHSQL